MNHCLIQAVIKSAPQMRYTKENKTPIAEMIVKFQGLFGTSNFVIVDNNKPDEDIMTMAQKRVRQLVKQPIQNGRARAWIKRELDKRRKK